MNTELNEIYGSYKISEKLLTKIVSKEIQDSKGCIHKSVSSLELDALIYFTHISDIKGCVKEFKISELQEVIGCSVRSTYIIINNLEEKGYVTVKGNSWTGIKSIQILDNDFSGNVDYTENLYLNTNYEYFDYNKDSYQTYKSLSLFAKKTLLIILFKYKSKYGYRISVDTIKEYLGIKSRFKVVSYLKELEYLLGSDFYTIAKDSRRRIKHGNITMTHHTISLLASSGIEEDQDTYFKYYWTQYLKSEEIIDSKLSKSMKKTINKLLNDIYKVVYIYVQHAVSIHDINNIIKNTIQSLRIMDMPTAQQIIVNLRATFGKLQDCDA